MASPEHGFVTETFINFVAEYSASALYGYQEADRGELDFACLLDRDKSRHVIGQTLKSHADGIEKDLNTLLHANESDIGIYLVSAKTRHIRRVHEVIERARRVIPGRVAMLRVIQYPADFDINDDSERAFLREHLRKQVVDDLLLNVVFGRLSRHDVSYIVSSLEIGRDIAVLHTIATVGYSDFLRNSSLVQRLLQQPRAKNYATKAIQSVISDLAAAGMISRAIDRTLYRVTQRGRVFLSLCSILHSRSPITTELAYILGRLGLGDGKSYFDGEGPRVTSRHTPQSRREYLLFNLSVAEEDFGIVPARQYSTEIPEGDKHWMADGVEFVER
ncbi:hypothetical protein ABZU25_10305 [Micromonospora sp. NPDC005215]|uniref:hypothetical protein n=1 Tax=Micromonospora sp. NPDC005215 TaxID=3157024 RepID=UPI0033BB8AA8